MGNHIWPLIILVLIYLAPAAASGCLSLLAATVASIATDNTSNNASTVITANTIASWNTLSSSINAAAGKVVTLTLSTPFDMTGFQWDSSINIATAQTAITIVGNGAVFDAAGKANFFNVFQAVALVMSDVTLQNGYTQGGGGNRGGAIFVFGTITLSDCSFIGNTATGNVGGAIYAGDDGTITLSDCSFIGNTATYGGGAIYADSTITLSDCSFVRNTATSDDGGALGFGATGSNGLLKNCSLLGTVSPKNNDIARDTRANVTFACADGEVGTPVQMSGTEITKIPAPTCTTLYYCPSGAHACVRCDYIGCGGIKNLTECNQICI
jgi:predicted outer membrane repeat protein